MPDLPATSQPAIYRAIEPGHCFASRSSKRVGFILNSALYITKLIPKSVLMNTQEVKYAVCYCYYVAYGLVFKWKKRGGSLMGMFFTDKHPLTKQLICNVNIYRINTYVLLCFLLSIQQ